MNNDLILPRQLICGYFDCSVFGDLSVSPERTRTLFEIEYFLEDGKNIYSNGSTYKIKKEHVLIGAPGERCNSQLPFKTKFLKFWAEGRLADLLRESPRYFHVSRAFELESLLDSIISLQSSDKSDDPALYGNLLLLISLVLEESKSRDSGHSTTEIAVYNAKRYVDSHYAEPIRLKDIALSAQLSPSYFHSVFTSVCGITPHEYLTERRIRAAKELLSGTSLSMGEIAERCGFCSQQYMSEVFKLKLGTSPVACRKKYMKDYLT